MKIYSNKTQILKYLGWIIFCAIVYFPVFQDIDRIPLQFWDESRNAINAFEMSENGNYLVRYYNGEPDMWELNPPLLIWLQSTSMKIFGYNEFGLRFPTSLAVLSTIILLIYFSVKELNTIWIGILSSLVLITSQGYIGIHIGRTGDHDAVLIFFLAASCVNYYKHLKYFNETSKYLSFTSLFLILAFYTKSVAGLFTLPGMFIYTIFRGKLKSVLADYRTYVSLLIFVLFASAYYVIREILVPGTWEIFWHQGMFPRITNNDTEVELFQPGYWWYFENLIQSRFSYWIPFLFLPLFFIKRIKEKALFDALVFSYTIAFVTLFSLSTLTKHFWYDGPAYPFFALICGIALYALSDFMIDKLKASAAKKNILISTCLVLVFCFPYLAIVDKVYKPKEWDSRLYNGLFVRHLKKENKNYYNYHMFFRWYNAPVEFYVKALNVEGKHKVNVLGDQVQNVLVHDTIMSCDWANYNVLDSAFHLSTIEQFEHCRMYVVDSLKN